MSRKNVEVETPSGSQYYVKNSVAHRMVSDGEAYFTDDTQRRIRVIDSRLQASGPQSFRDAWKLKPSGGIPVWQMNT